MLKSKKMLYGIECKKQSIAKTKEQIEQLSYSLTSTTVKPKEVNVMTSKSDSFGENIAKLIDKKIELKEKENNLKSYIAFIEKKINLMENEYYRKILSLRYIENKTLSEISVILGKEYSNIRHAHGRALQSLEKIFS